MKTALSIPDDVFAEAERLTLRLGKSRSQLYTEAVREYLARHDPDAITEALNRIYEDSSAKPDSAVLNVGRQILEQVEW